jgi:hypothetical protein
MTLRLLTSRSISMAGLWTLVIVAGLLVLGSVRSLPPNDLWWHARVGSEILDGGRIPSHDVYSLTERGRPFFYQSWLSEALMAGLLRLGGVRLLVFTRALIMTGLFGAVMILCWRAGGGDRRVAIPATLSAIVLGFGNQTVRPQLFAYPLFITVYALLWRYRRGEGERSVWLIPVLTAVWVNLHGSFTLGLGLVWIVFLGELLGYALPTLASTRPSTKERIRVLGLVALLSVAVLLINPRGVGVVSYVRDLLTDAPSQLLGTEWQPPNPKSGLGLVFYPLLLWVVATLALARPTVALTDLLLVLAFAWLGASGVRYVVWFGLISAPILAEALLSLPRDDLVRWRDRLTRHTLGQRLVYGDGSGYPGFRRLAVAGAIVPLFVVGALFFFYPDDDLWLSKHTGTAAVDFMERNGIRGRLFNELGRGSYLIWRLGPAQPVFIDPRFELYSLEHFEHYLWLSNAKGDVEALLDEYDFELLLLDGETQAPLVEFVDGQPERWQQIYGDDNTLLYQRVEE